MNLTVHGAVINTQTWATQVTHLQKAQNLDQNAPSWTTATIHLIKLYSSVQITIKKCKDTGGKINKYNYIKLRLHVKQKKLF